MLCSLFPEDRIISYKESSQEHKIKRIDLAVSVEVGNGDVYFVTVSRKISAKYRQVDCIYLAVIVEIAIHKVCYFAAGRTYFCALAFGIGFPFAEAVFCIIAVLLAADGADCFLRACGCAALVVGKFSSASVTNVLVLRVGVSCLISICLVAYRAFTPVTAFVMCLCKCVCCYVFLAVASRALIPVICAVVLLRG